jgi:hypothetical protein
MAHREIRQLLLSRKTALLAYQTLSLVRVQSFRLREQVSTVPARVPQTAL